MKEAKYRTLILLCFCIALFSFFQIEAKVVDELSLFGKIIFVDPGHGGRDPGAIQGSTYEKDLNLEISLVLRDTLMEKGAIVYMTRENDEDLSSKWDPLKKRGDLYRRILMFRKKNADLYLSIHMNYHSDHSQRGIEVLYNSINPQNKVLGTILMDHFKKDFYTKRILRTTNLYMYKNTTVPGVLIECGFISNSYDRANLKNKDYQKRLANTITTSVIEFMS